MIGLTFLLNLNPFYTGYFTTHFTRAGGDVKISFIKLLNKQSWKHQNWDAIWFSTKLKKKIYFDVMSSLLRSHNHIFEK